MNKKKSAGGAGSKALVHLFMAKISVMRGVVTGESPDSEWPSGLPLCDVCRLMVDTN